MEDKWIIWGAGKNGARMLKFFRIYGQKVGFFVDINSLLWGERYEEIDIKAPTEIVSSYNVCISVVGKEKEIREYLMDRLDVPPDNIFYYVSCIINVMKNKLSGYIEGSDILLNKSRLILLGCTNGLGLGGVETWNLFFGNVFKKKGYNVKYLLRTIDVREDIKNFILVDIANYNDCCDIESIRKIAQVILNNMPIVIVTNYFNSFLLTACAVKLLYPDSVKIISVVHGGRKKLIGNYAAVDFAVDIFMGVARDGICNQLQKYGIDEVKIHHVVCPVPCMLKRERRYKGREEAIRIGYAARLTLKDKDKRADYLLPLIELLERSGISYELNIAGEGDFKEVIEDFVVRNMCGDHVHLYGLIPREEMQGFWQKQDIFLNVSDCEGNSMSMMEAMAQGAVPVLTDVSGVRDSVKDGVNGFIAKCGDLEEIKNFICFLNNNYGLLEIMGKKASDVIAEKYKEEEMIKRFENCIFS